MFSKKATKIDEIFTVNLTLCSKCQIDGEEFVNVCGLLRKHELYEKKCVASGITHMPVYHCHKPVLLGKWPLLQVCYKP